MAFVSYFFAFGLVATCASLFMRTSSSWSTTSSERELETMRADCIRYSKGAAVLLGLGLIAAGTACGREHARLLNQSAAAGKPDRIHRHNLVSLRSSLLTRETEKLQLFKYRLIIFTKFHSPKELERLHFLQIS